MENEKINITKLESELAYYKGFYEGVKEMTTLFPMEAVSQLQTASA